jgi:hypothetical protein
MWMMRWILGPLLLALVPLACSTNSAPGIVEHPDAGSDVRAVTATGGGGGASTSGAGGTTSTGTGGATSIGTGGPNDGGPGLAGSGGGVGGSGQGGNTRAGGSFGGDTSGGGRIGSGGSGGLAGGSGGNSGGRIAGSGGASGMGGSGSGGTNAKGGSGTGGTTGAGGNPAGWALPNHPGSLLRQSDLDRIRSNLASNREPWASAWAAIKNTGPGPTWTTGATGEITDGYALQNQGHTIWQLTVKWLGSGDIAYANAAKNGIDQWVDHVTSMQTISSLRTGVGGYQMANAAEILAHGFGGSAGWPAANIAKAKAWFKNVPYKQISGGVGSRTGNWGTSALTGCMAMAIFCDDQTMFDYAVNAYKLGFQDTTDGNCGVTKYIDATGEAMETGRDQGHVQGGLAHLVEVALMAWNQNVNIVTYNDTTCTVGVNGSYGVSGANRLFIGLEYEAKYNLGGTVSYHPFLTNWGQIYYPNGIAPRAGWSPVWEMTTHLFAISGMNATYTPQVLAVPGYAPESSNGDHVGYGTLLFRAE